uniref:cyclin-dependent kinase n=1 Tax=Paramecium caudatum TaxID=5885 RepID=Q5TKT5_PARCA|nr:putative MAP kinase [Paramecium caudatum]
MQKYEVQGIIGEGAYGIVLKGKNKENGEIVAIKQFIGSEEDESIKKTILREVKVLKMLNHENIVKLKEAFRRKGKLYIVLEFVEKNLLELLEEKSNGLDPELTRRFIYQLCQAIAYCHSIDVLHRDIKPENLLISDQQVLKVCDFGFARLLPQKQGQLTDYVATRWYRAPELLLGGEYGKGVDMWAIGCIMAELTDGQPLFSGQSEIDQLYVISKLLGPLTNEQKETFLKNPRYVGMKFHEITKPETIEKRFQGKLSLKAISFLKGLLKMDPNKRMTAIEALEHPYFDGIRDDQFYQFMKEQREREQFQKDRIQSANKLPAKQTQSINGQQQQQQKDGQASRKADKSNERKTNQVKGTNNVSVERVNNFIKPCPIKTGEKNTPSQESKSMPKKDVNSQLGFLQKNVIIGYQEGQFDNFLQNKMAQNYNYDIPENDLNNSIEGEKRQANQKLRVKKKSFNPEVTEDEQATLLRLKKKDNQFQQMPVYQVKKKSTQLRQNFYPTDEYSGDEQEVYQSKEILNMPKGQKQQQYNYNIGECKNTLEDQDKNLNIVYNNITYNYNINNSPGWMTKKRN